MLSSTESARLRVLLSSTKLEEEDEEEVQLPDLSGFWVDHEPQQKSDGPSIDTAVAEFMLLAEKLNISREGVEALRLLHNK